MARNTFGLTCPQCRDGGRIDICATVWVRLTPDGTDADESGNGDHEWEGRSLATCSNCDWEGTVNELKRG